ncbi:5-methyltetrahydropteroyltriglutamate--homocysteine methyltransferase [Ligilactobacillus salitolerans]|uniref:5-methyltetrahydropteroyltriglutamate--homocysteine methyltransferase n=1 Tax=Ligilactobacillus salitolerans TaxID=1808352 RepID=A0A401IQF7_9LACO|nr:hypothetical protein [Ligilactobacillus salitolerans]GBG93756.1 5-methyltetrahydropteroyltriglutamate--homocysteine methyltransferase [Ligilactobacillus salitolerans]
MAVRAHQYFYTYDTVGSFLRPKKLKLAYDQVKAGEISSEEFAEIKHTAIKELVQKQVAHGLHVVSDGEFNRKNFFIDFLAGLAGIKVIPNGFKLNFSGHELVDDGLELDGKIGYDPAHPFFADFEFLDSITPKDATTKVTIPAPTPLLFEGDFAVISNYREFYADREAYLADILSTYQQTVAHFYKLGLRYLQLDDPWLLGVTLPLAGLEGKENETRVAKLEGEIISLIQQIIATAPSDMIITTHICRGNFHSASLGGGTYGSILNVLKKLPYDAFFLEYDDLQAAGGFEPLAVIHRAQLQAVFVLGLVTTKTPQLELERELQHQILLAEDAVPLRNLALSPQCGFASTKEGNDLNEPQQWQKVDLVVRTARDTWKTDACRFD